MNFDEQQRQAIDSRENVVVSAGAGSGKTRVLTERYISLLRDDGAVISEILALTFTRKAAAEMFGRIYDRLREESAGSHHLQVALEHFDEARISTIDSFCAAVVRDSATRYGLPSRIVTDDRRFRDNARRKALGFVMEHGDTQALGPYVRQYGLDGTIDSLILPLITSHIGIARPRTFVEDFEYQEAWLRRRKSDLSTQIDTVVDEIRGMKVSSKSAVGAQEGCIARAGDYRQLYEFCRGVKKTFGNKDDATALKESMTRLIEKRSKRYYGLLAEWYAVDQTQGDGDTRRELYELFDRLREDVITDRRRSGLLTYNDIVELAVRALTEDMELRRVYRDQFRYIMIDEFQDNNSLQRDLLFLLSDGDLAPGIPQSGSLSRGKLFFVGDQKQSIYRFRGADVSVFKQLARDIATSSDTPHIGLGTNYRSAPHLLRFYNALFPSVFENPEESYEAEFTPLQIPPGTESGESEIVVAWVGTGEDQDEVEDAPADPAFAEADWIAKTIRELIDADRHTPGEIAILLRSSAGQQRIERMLRRRGIPYQTQAIRSLFTEAPASDAYSILQLVFFPDDEEALATFLRSPFVMLSDTGLVTAITFRRDGHDLFAFDLDSSGIAALSETDAVKLSRAARLYQELATMVDRVSHSEIIRYLWDDTGYRYAILHRSSDHSYLEHYDYLFSLALRYQDRSMIEFVDFLREQIGQTEKIDELDVVTNDEAVQILTVHKSKGLEYPVVFVADCDRQLQTRSDCIWIDAELGLTVRSPKTTPDASVGNVIEAHAQEDEKNRSDAELKRLLYVAATRAEKRLYFTAAVRTQKRGSSFFSLLTRATGLDIENGTVEKPFDDLIRLEEIPPILQSDLLSVPVPQGARRSRKDAVGLLEQSEPLRYTFPDVDTTPSQINVQWRAATGIAFGDTDTADDGNDDNDGRSEEPGSSDATVLGTLTHRLLELQISAIAEARSEIPSAEWQPEHPDVRRLVFDLEQETERAALCRTSWELSRRFLDSPFWKELTQRAIPRSIECEVPFLLRVDTPRRFINGKVDLVAELEKEVVIVDFKTDVVADPAHYEGQIAVYRYAVEELFGKSVRSYLFFLRHTGEVEVSPELPEVLAAIDLPENEPTV